MTVRTASARPGITEAYATLGAGSRVSASDNLTDSFDRGPDGLVLNAGSLRAEAGSNPSSPPGALGDALHAAHLRTAVLGSGDIPPGLVNIYSAGRPRQDRLRPALAALADRDGRVDIVGGGLDSGAESDLLMADPLAPFGLRADPGEVLTATRAALEQADVVLVDPGDLTRVAALGEGDAPERYRSRAIADTDSLIGSLVTQVPPDTLVLIVAPTPPDRHWRLTPTVVVGLGAPVGELHSPSTRQPGLVTLTDVAPTVLASLGVPVSADLVGHALRYTPGPASLARMARLDRDDTYRESMYLRVVVAFIVVQAFVYLLVALAVRRRRSRAVVSQPSLGVRWLRLAVLAIAALPLATFIFRGIPFAASWG
ncbi:MAG: hypothetical protein ACRDRT_11570, partial [Pseudonocardiaceae bacterium]